MAAVSNKDIPDDFNMFGELFNLHKKYYYPDNTDEYWKAVHEDFKKLCQKYKTEFTEDLSFVVIKEFERKAKGCIHE
ncbi:MAG: hypothetical protein K0R92_437 [Lachnospiraceae bacterium]|jgi:hypothetical protein|nr:hypothetical protein [Lachnospiraceae bacterium]